MFHDAFKKLEMEEVATLLEDINPHFEHAVFDPLQTTILAHDLPFYPGYRFLDIADYSVSPEKRRFVVYKDQDIVILNWSNEPIYALNLKVPIQLTQYNIADYIRFFFTYVRGKHGRFIVSETVDDIAWKEEPPPAARKAIGKMLLPLTGIAAEEGGIFKTKATMMFRDSLFRADLEIKRNGLVQISNEELLVEDMPVRDDTFGQ